MWLVKPICKKSTLKSDIISYTKEEIHVWKTETVYEEIYVAVYGELMNILNCQKYYI